MGYFQELGGHVGSDDGAKEKLLDACAIIATFSKTKYEGKPSGHGGYNFYQDDKVVIELDTYVPNIRVLLLLGDKRETVLFYNFGGFAQAYRPGKWEQYILNNVFPKAQAIKEAADNEVATAKAAEQEQKFGPIDDAALFV